MEHLKTIIIVQTALLGLTALAAVVISICHVRSLKVLAGLNGTVERLGYKVNARVSQWAGTSRVTLKQHFVLGDRFNKWEEGAKK